MTDHRPIVRIKPEVRRALGLPEDDAVDFDVPVFRKLEPPPFTCSLCDAESEGRRGDLAWEGAGVCLCIKCYRGLWARRANKNYWRLGLTWNDKNDLELAGYLAGALEREARGVRG